MSDNVYAPARIDNEPEEDVDPNLRYEARVSLSMEELVQSFAEDPRVAWYPNADPPAFGSPGAHDFEAWPTDTHGLVVRTNVPATMQVASPYVLIEMSSLQHEGTHVRARFVRRPPGVQLGAGVRTVLAVSCVLGIIGWVAYVIWLPLMLFHPTLWLTVVCCVGGILTLAQYSKNRPKAESMAAFGGPLWGLVGSKLVPHAIGGGEDPFRLKALGVRSR